LMMYKYMNDYNKEESIRHYATFEFEPQYTIQYLLDPK